MGCRRCGASYDEFRWFSEGVPERCRECGEPDGEHFGQRWMENRPAGRVYGESSATTFGQQAELNAKRAGKEQMQKMAEQEAARRRGWSGPTPPGAESPRPEAARPWWRDSDAPLDLAGVRDVERYIMTGEK